MATETIAAAVLGGLALLLAVGVSRAGELRVDDPAALARTRSLGRVIADSPDRPVHILYVHGMRAEGPGFAQTFMSGLCRYAPVECPAKSGFQPVERRRFELGAWPRNASVMGRPIWTSAEAWAASRPFVDRYVFARHNAPPVVVDEVNWWPMLFPLKCRFLLAPEAKLSGVDKAHLALCRRSDDPFYPWLTEAEWQEALKGPRISRGGAWANAALKQQIMNWGLADAVVTLGPMRSLLRRTMESVFDYAASFDGRGVTGQEFVVVSESLGSFMVMDAAANPQTPAAMARQVIQRTSNLYFFANQFALLEIGRISGLDGLKAGRLEAAATPAEVGPFDMLRAWAAPPPAPLKGPPPPPKQVIAFSDPSDALTYDVPKLRDENGQETAIVVNIYDRNEFDWFGLFAWPIDAHAGHSRNADVLRLMFRP